MPPISVLVADGERLFAEALGDALRDQPDFAVVDEHPGLGEQAVAAVLHHRPDVVLFDYWMLGMDGPQATHAILAWAPGTRVLLLSWVHGPEQVQKGLNAGAVGFLPKSLPLEKVVEAVRRAGAGERLVFGEELAQLVDVIEQRHQEAVHRADGLMTLTRRETEVLKLLAEGRHTKALARELGITVGTLKNHIHRILTKTGARTQLEAIRLARYEQLIPEVGPPRPEQP